MSYVQADLRSAAAKTAAALLVFSKNQSRASTGAYRIGVPFPCGIYLNGSASCWPYLESRHQSFAIHVAPGVP